jgi:hypothetical protein
MVSSAARTVDAYLASLPPERRDVVSTMRSVVRKHLPAGYVETMNWGMICYEVPMSRYPATYNNQPLSYVALAAQKNHFAFYLMAVSEDSSQEQYLKQAFAKIGKKPDMGKCCVRFSKLADVPLDAIGRTIASLGVDDYIALYEQHRGLAATKSRAKTPATKPAARTAMKKSPAAKPAAKRAATKAAVKKATAKKATAKKAAARKTARK